MNIIGLSGSLSAPSRTRALVAAVIGEISRQTGHGGPLIDLADIAADLGRTLGSFVLPPAIEAAHGQLRAADLIVIGVPGTKPCAPDHKGCARIIKACARRTKAPPCRTPGRAGHPVPTAHD